MKKKTIIIIAGGTCGHIFPGLIIAKKLIQKNWNVFWLGTRNRLESIIIPKNKIPIQFIDIDSIKKKFFSLIKFSFQVLRACYQSRCIIKCIKPNIILGMGGYISIPGGIISTLYRIPFLIHEQNRVAGLSNKFLSKLSTKTMQAFPGTISNAQTVGNPLRKEIINFSHSKNRFKNRTGPLRILVLGGSQGAQIFNSTLPEIAFSLKNKIIIWHQVGKNNKVETLRNYKKFKIFPYKLNSFIKNIEKAYSWADMVICRSGAITVSEIEYIGLPAIFIPYPHKDKHQYWNAYPLKLKGGAIIIEQNSFKSHKIVKILNNINRKIINKMSKKIHSKLTINSVKKIVKIINNIASISNNID
ncbi:MAG: undecaprenyldiphospho-muramoylpentapeptide beta-N-acetylglucosaminyltransferase [Buchnera aphidicola (Nurudea shiraii)]